MFYYNENALSDMLSDVDKNINQMFDMENGYLNKMESISKSGMYGNGIEMIDSQIVSIKDGLTDFRNITNNNKNAIKETENRLKIEVSKIKLPENFDPSDVGIIVEASNFSLNKNNGKLINSDNVSNIVTIDDYKNINIDEIKKFAKDALDKINLDEYLKTKEINIENINNNTTNKVQIDDYNETEKTDLNVIKKTDLSKNVLDEYKETQKTRIASVNNNENNNNLIGVSEDIISEEFTRGDNNDYKS